MTEPKKLYHYTDFDGLTGIIEKQSLWLSNRKCMSDTREFTRSERLIKKCTKEAIKEYQESIQNHTDSINECNRIFINNSHVFWEIFMKNLPEAYLFCFCVHKRQDQGTQKNGLLSMWRGYGEKGGYALVFNREKIEDYIGRSSNYPAGSIFEPITYLRENDFRIFGNRLDDYNRIKDDIKARLIPLFCDEKIGGKDEGHAATEALLKLIILIKHFSFREECEYRLCFFNFQNITLLNGNDSLDIKIRKRSSSMISYIEFPVILKDLVKEIIIGPQRDMQTKKDFLDGYLKSQGLKNIKVRVSEIPYLPR